MRENVRVFGFALSVTVVCSLLLATAATVLKPMQQTNIKVDIKKNIPSVVGIKASEGESYTRAQIEELYAKNIKEMVLDMDGNIIEGKKPTDIDPKKDTNLHALYEYVVDDQIKAYIIPIEGKGLWSTLYGYFALEPDLNTVKGITFYQHGETPGLGGEVEKEWFTDNFIGKKILDEEGNLTSVSVVKGKVSDAISNEAQRVHYVDGISGATITGRGLTKFLKEDLQSYQPFFKQMRNNQEES